MKYNEIYHLPKNLAMKIKDTKVFTVHHWLLAVAVVRRRVAADSFRHQHRAHDHLGESRVRHRVDRDPLENRKYV